MTFWHKFFNDFDTTYDLVLHTIQGDFALLHPELGRLKDNSFRSNIYKWPDNLEMQELFPDATPTGTTELYSEISLTWLFVDRFRPVQLEWCQEWVLWYYSILEFYKYGIYEYEDISPNGFDFIGDVEIEIQLDSSVGKLDKEDLYITYLTYEDNMHLNRKVIYPIATSTKLIFKVFKPFLYSAVVAGLKQDLVSLVSSELDSINTDILYSNRQFDQRYKCRDEDDPELEEDPDALILNPQPYQFEVSGTYINNFNYRMLPTKVYSWQYLNAETYRNDIILPTDNEYIFAVGFNNEQIRTPTPIQNDPPDRPPEITASYNDLLYNLDYLVETGGVGGWWIAEIPINLEKARIVVDTSTREYITSDDPNRNNRPNLTVDPTIEPPVLPKCADIENVYCVIAATNNHWEIETDITLEDVGEKPDVFFNGEEFILTRSTLNAISSEFTSWVIYEDIVNNVFYQSEDFVVGLVQEGDTPGITNTNQQFNTVRLYDSLAILLGNGLNTSAITGIAYLGAGSNLGEDLPTFVPGGFLNPRLSVNPKTNAVILDSGPYFNHLFFTLEVPIGRTIGNFTAGYGYRPGRLTDEEEDIYYRVDPENEEIVNNVIAYWTNIERNWFAMISNIDLKEIREIVDSIPFIDRAISAQQLGIEVEDPATGEMIGRPTNLAWHIMGIAKFFGMNYNSNGTNSMISASSSGVTERRPIQIVSGNSESATAGLEDRSGNYPFGCVGFSNEDTETGQINFGDPVDSVNAYPQFVYKVKSNQFLTTEFGSQEIAAGDYVICYTFQQIMQTIMQDLDKAIGMASAGANAIPNADGSEKVCTYEGLGQLVAENAYMLSSVSRQTGQGLVSSLIAQGVVIELLKATGYPLQFKEIKADVAQLGNVAIPYPGLGDNSPTINSQMLDILNNLGPLIANLLCPVEPQEETN